MLFENFYGRGRESIRIAEHMLRIGVFIELPKNTISFIIENYGAFIPYHNRIHIFYGLLWLHHKDAPLLAKLAWIGHDAGHNGIKEESPEIQSAFLTWQWLNNHREWLAERNIDPQDCTRIIDATRFPYAKGSKPPDEMIQWVRWADVMRVCSGDTASYLSETSNRFVFTGHRFCAYFFESSQIFREMCTGQSDFIAWFLNAQSPFFQNLRKMLKTGSICGYYVKDWNDICAGFNEVEKYLIQLYGTEEGKTFLLNAYNFLSNDVTYPEFEEFFFQNF